MHSKQAGKLNQKPQYQLLVKVRRLASRRPATDMNAYSVQMGFILSKQIQYLNTILILLAHKCLDNGGPIVYKSCNKTMGSITCCVFQA